MPRPSGPDNPAGKRPAPKRSYRVVQLPPFPGTVPYEQAVAAVRAVKQARKPGKPA